MTTLCPRRSLWFVLVLALSACMGVPEDITTERERSAITNGVPESGYMAVFSLAYDGQGGCSGTCITPRIGLTAAHCFWDGDEAEDFSGLFGDTESSPSIALNVTAFAKAPGSDLAVVAFSEPCPATIPYNRAPLEDHLGEPVVMVGFGVTTEDADDAGIKRSGTATLFSVDPSEVHGLDPNELATSNVPAGTCNGDSGGPTFMTIDGVEVMVGTTSRGSVNEQGIEYPCGQGYSIAVRADSYRDFIDDFIAVHDPEALDADPPGGDDEGTPEDEDDSDGGGGDGYDEAPRDDRSDEGGADDPDVESVDVDELDVSLSGGGCTAALSQPAGTAPSVIRLALDLI